ncbi:2-isopropylmalate synthase [Streptomyces sp. Ag109_G2-15]|uniref:2-isopropylmalate synthase n=1 Tax=Streptomyces sp. Ag109_G2-15 TaxID=1938850 RepID=UPI000BDAEBC3|nr:2-isopropylmalate synthase [Streptomyces sp. Ag109_G2-15]SOD83497.1 2-isopropylmalate synthase [Streptomyces sp. Ag109_G2-15]
MTLTSAQPLWNPQRPGPMPYHRYQPHDRRVHVPVTERHWPAARIERAPLWVPVDLRDGNQALAEPMDTPRKRRFFDLLVSLGYKEIEIGYPSASRTDFAFVRHLVTSGAVPEDVTPVVFTPARTELIDRTFEAIEGLPRAVVHLYIATSPVWREVVLRRDRAGVRRTLRTAAEHMARRAGDAPGIRFQFSPETFNLTEPDFVLELCDGLTELWDASPDRPVIHNLPATVEIATPNVYADQIEYAHRHLSRRDSVILSVHPHNDRGTGVACAELAVLAGAQRVEGCLFGNGERTGNVDLVTLALNLFAQGVDPMVDFGDIDAVREVVEECNRLPVHPRHPYAGELVHTAFSGTHQDAIGKGLAEHARRAAESGVPERQAPWSVPYLPVDPADLGRSYEAVIRVNSQSGKGGTAYLLHTHHGVDLPAEMRPEVARLVQEATDDSGREATPKELYDLFRTAYLEGDAVRLDSWSVLEEAPGRHRFVCTLRLDGGRAGDHEGTGTGPLTAFADALAGAGFTVRILDSVRTGRFSYARCRVNGTTLWGAAEDDSALSASVRAVLSAVNRATPR